MNDKLVFIAPNPPWRHHEMEVCSTHVCSPPSLLDYAITLHLLSLPSFPRQRVFFYHCKWILPVVASQGRLQLRSFTCLQCCASWASSGEVSDTSSSSASPQAEGSALYPAVSLCLWACAASHQLQPDIRPGCSSWHWTAQTMAAFVLSPHLTHFKL